MDYTDSQLLQTYQQRFLKDSVLSVDRYRRAGCCGRDTHPHYQVLVKVVNMFGNDTSHLLTWEAR